MTEQKKISTTQLAKKRGIVQTELFIQLSNQGLMRKDDDKWFLTLAGEQLGGVHLSGKYGQYVAWPEDVNFELSVTTPNVVLGTSSQKLITATAIGKHFDISSKKMNYVLSELGWIKRGLKGWLVKQIKERN